MLTLYHTIAYLSINIARWSFFVVLILDKIIYACYNLTGRRPCPAVEDAMIPPLIHLPSSFTPNQFAYGNSGSGLLFCFYFLNIEKGRTFRRSASSCLWKYCPPLFSQCSFMWLLGGALLQVAHALARGAPQARALRQIVMDLLRRCSRLSPSASQILYGRRIEKLHPKEVL